ncbi:hypothetical protein HCN44_008661 [Aphidius gifuensis]|uniref:Acylphosphatase n=2 Tax=Aphidius gifuensis TaxID=684658 RepID=A0A835CN84_APHGI|nr:hypothetical protein HCN44_008661 [Aphidius gifuensis]
MQNNIGLDFEVFGRVQGVFFRKYTQKKAEELFIKGWCMNTKEGSVVGRLEGDKQKIEEMKEWLRVTGSPQSSIVDVKFKNEQIIDKINYPNFAIKK